MTYGRSSCGAFVGAAQVASVRYVPQTCNRVSTTAWLCPHSRPSHSRGSGAELRQPHTPANRWPCDMDASVPGCQSSGRGTTKRHAVNSLAKSTRARVTRPYVSVAHSTRTSGARCAAAGGEPRTLVQSGVCEGSEPNMLRSGACGSQQHRERCMIECRQKRNGKLAE